MSTAKDEALRAIAHAAAILNSNEPIDGLKGVQLRGALLYAAEMVDKIQEIKRKRRAKANGQ